MKMLTVEVVFRRAEEGGRSYTPKRLLESRLYRPHLTVVSPDMATPEDYLGVCFWQQEGDLEPGRECVAKVVLMYDGVDYSKLQAGACFYIVEGKRIVGTGHVK